MATVPSPITFVDNTVVTAADLNTIRDALNFLLAPPLAIVNQSSATQNLSSGVWTAILFDTEVIDRDGMHSTSSNTSRLTCVTPGYYAVEGMVAFHANATGGRGADFAINGTRVFATAVLLETNDSATFYSAVAVVGTVYLNVGDYLELQGVQYSGGTLSTGILPDLGCSLTARWMST